MKSVSIWLVAMVGSVLSVGAFFLIRDWNITRQQIEFERQAHIRIQSIDHALAHRKNILRAVRELCRFNPSLDRQMFQTFVDQMLVREPVISALAFIPRVDGHRQSFSAKSPRWHDQSGPSVVERTAEGAWIPAGNRAEYFPVWFVEPAHHAELVRGWDVGSDPLLKTALERARDSGKPAAAAIFLISDGKNTPPAEVYLYAPIFQGAVVPERIEDRRQRLLGFVCAAFNIDKLVQHAVNDIPSPDLTLRIQDVSLSKPRLIFTSPLSRSVDVSAASLGFAQIVEVADNRWKIECFAAPNFGDSSHRKLPWVALGGCLLLTVLLTVHLVRRRLADEALRLYQQKLQTLALQSSAAEEQERRRIAGNLHDRVSQGLAVAMMKLALLRKAVHTSKVTSEIEGLEKVLGQVLDNSRSLTSELSPPVLYELGLEPAIEWAASQMRKRFGLEVRVQCDGQSKPLDEKIRSVLFHATCELMVNIGKHAGTRTATVSVERNDGQIWICVKDNGAGFDVSTIGSNHAVRDGFGLFNIRERLQHLDGRFQIESTLGEGTIATLVAPLKPEQPQIL